MIAGLEDITEGELMIGDAVANDVHASKRGIAMVFQSYALYPHMSVYDNMAFSLKLAGADKAEIDKRVQRAAEILQITHLLERKPKALSGGQRQRVAIGRAIVREPQVFLFDEPLSNLDASLRLNMRVELSKLHADLKTTMIYVTHDQVEAMTLADRIVVFNAGVVQQVGSPLEMYENPANLFVAGFLGSPKMNLLEAQLVGVENGLAVVRLPKGITVRAAVDASRATAGSKVTLGVRPEHIQLATEGDVGIPARVDLVEHLAISYWPMWKSRALTTSCRSSCRATTPALNAATRCAWCFRKAMRWCLMKLVWRSSAPFDLLPLASCRKPRSCGAFCFGPATGGLMLYLHHVFRHMLVFETKCKHDRQQQGIAGKDQPDAVPVAHAAHGVMIDDGAAGPGADKGAQPVNDGHEQALGTGAYGRADFFLDIDRARDVKEIEGAAVHHHRQQQPHHAQW